jgi:hypothetical protein
MVASTATPEDIRQMEISVERAQQAQRDLMEDLDDEEMEDLDDELGTLW